MKRAHIRATTIDDALRSAITLIRAKGTRVVASKGPNREISGVLIEITQPRARLSRTESRGKVFSCLGELCWYLSGSRQTDFIVHYIDLYRQFDEKGIIHGGYGPRLFGTWKGTSQFRRVLGLLRSRRSTRQATIQLFDAQDLVGKHRDVPCTCTLQFLLRDEKLHLVTYMRSNDVIKGFPHDVFCFTMLQEIAARVLGIEVGAYKHCVGSLHLYDGDKRRADSFIREGWQSTRQLMPPMPQGDPWPEIHHLLEAERRIRNGQDVTRLLLKASPYWADLIRLLQIFDCKKKKQRSRIQRVRKAMANAVYDMYIERHARRR